VVVSIQRCNQSSNLSNKGIKTFLNFVFLQQEMERIASDSIDFGRPNINGGQGTTCNIKDVFLTFFDEHGNGTTGDCEARPKAGSMKIPQTSPES